MNKISLSDKPAAFLFICLCGPIVIDLEKDYAFFSLMSLPPVSPLSILSICKGEDLITSCLGSVDTKDTTSGSNQWISLTSSACAKYNI